METTPTITHTCKVCGGPADLFAICDGKPCMACIRSRQRAAMDGRCHCGAKRIEGPEAGGARRGARRWIPCLRCLGTVRQTG